MLHKGLAKARAEIGVPTIVGICSELIENYYFILNRLCSLLQRALELQVI